MFKLFIYWVYDASPSWSLGCVLMFVHLRKKTHLPRFSTGVYKERSFNSWRGRIFHLAHSYFPFQMFSLKNPCPSEYRRRGCTLQKYSFSEKKQANEIQHRNNNYLCSPPQKIGGYYIHTLYRGRPGLEKNPLCYKHIFKPATNR